MTNVTTASFAGGRTVAADPLYQWDYGQVLKIMDLPLPVAYEVHFAASRSAATSYTVIGDADGVAIPDILLTTGASVYAWLYLHAGEDDGETVFQVVIPVIARPQPSNGTPTPVQQDAITQAIAALNAAVELCESYGAHGPRIVEGVWAVWDAETSQYVTTGVEATGPQGPEGPAGSDGYSPTVTVEAITGGHRVTITDAEGDHVFDIMDGQGGQGSGDVFIAAYGTTTNAEIETALAAGQIVFCKLTNAGVDYYLPMTRRYGSANHRFAGSHGGNDGVRTVGASCVDNVWSTWSRLMMATPSGSNGDVLAYDGSTWSGKALTASDVGAVAVAQGVGHAGEFLVVGSDGNVTTVTLATWQGGSY